MMSRLHASPIPKEEYKNLGISAFKRKDYIMSLGYFSVAHEHFPHDMVILEWKIKCYYELKQIELCLKNIRGAELASLDMITMESKIYLDRHDFANIAECAQKNSDKENESKLKNLLEGLKAIKNLYEKMMELKQKQQYKQASQCIKQLIQKLPLNQNTTKLKIEQLECLMKCGELDEAKKIFETFDQHSESSTLLFCLRLKLYFYMRDEAKYKQLIDKGQSLLSKNPQFQELETIIEETEFNLKQGLLCLEYKKYPEALRIFKASLSIDPHNKLANSNFYFNKARIYKKLGKKQEAQACFNKSIELNPKDINVRRQRALFSIEHQDYVAAILEYQKLIEIDQKNNQFYRREIKNLQKLDKINGKQDYYQILNIEKGSEQDDIKRAFKALALKYHPDRNRNKLPHQIAENSYNFMQITEAYKTLSDSETRKKYDNSLQENESHQSAEKQSDQSESSDLDEEEESKSTEKEQNQSKNNSRESPSPRRSRDKPKRPDNNKHNSSRNQAFANSARRSSPTQKDNRGKDNSNNRYFNNRRKNNSNSFSRQHSY